MKLIVIPYHHKEEDYLQWCKSNPNGFVFNHFGGRDASMNILHRTSCRYLWRKKDEGVRTNVEKLCSNDEETLLYEVTRLRGASWKNCSNCHRG